MAFCLVLLEMGAKFRLTAAEANLLIIKTASRLIEANEALVRLRSMKSPIRNLFRPNTSNCRSINPRSQIIEAPQKWCKKVRLRPTTNHVISNKVKSKTKGKMLARGKKRKSNKSKSSLMLAQQSTSPGLQSKNNKNKIRNSPQSSSVRLLIIFPLNLRMLLKRLKSSKNLKFP